MGRRSKAHLEAANRRTIDLALLRFSPKEIAEEVGFSAYTVRQWIRQSGVVPSTRDLVLSLAEEGLAILEIAHRARVSERRIREILQEIRGPARRRRTPEENVERFLADPEAHMGKRFTESRPFSRALIRKCASVTDLNPHQGLEVIRPAVRLLERLRESRKGETAHLVTCRLLQGRGIEAHANMQLNKHRRAWQILETNLALAEGRCGACEADYKRRFGLVMGSWAFSTGSRRRWGRAVSLMDEALEAYRLLPDGGHDVYGNGLAHCYLDRSVLSYHAVGPTASAADARLGLTLVSAAESETLHRSLFHSLAVALKDSEDLEELAQAHAFIMAAVRELDGKASVPALRTTWLAGLIAARCAEVEASVHLLSDALEYAHELKLPCEVSAITADLGIVDPNPREIRAQIEGLCRSENHDWVLPRWLDSRLLDGLVALYKATERRCADRIRCAASRLREAAQSADDGGDLIPQLVPAS